MPRIYRFLSPLGHRLLHYRKDILHIASIHEGNQRYIRYAPIGISNSYFSYSIKMYNWPVGLIIYIPEGSRLAKLPLASQQLHAGSGLHPPSLAPCLSKTCSRNTLNASKCPMERLAAALLYSAIFLEESQPICLDSKWSMR